MANLEFPLQYGTPASFSSITVNGGQATFADGTAALPGIAYTSEPSTGFRRSGAGALQLSLTGTGYYNWTAAAFYPNTAGASDLGLATTGGWKRFYLNFINSATTGNQTISTPTGSFQIAAAGTTATITNTLVTANSVITVFLMTVDATAKTAVAVPAAGSFTVTLNVAATAQVKVGWILVSTD